MKRPQCWSPLHSGHTLHEGNGLHADATTSCVHPSQGVPGPVLSDEGAAGEQEPNKSDQELDA